MLNDEPCMIRSTLTEPNPVEIKYYPSKISLDKCTGISNELSPNICISKKTHKYQGIQYHNKKIKLRNEQAYVM